jgi:hypothetical protein
MKQPPMVFYYYFIKFMSLIANSLKENQIFMKKIKNAPSTNQRAFRNQYFKIQ